jgi:hypothetical protein
MDLNYFYHIFKIYYGIQNGLPKALFKIQLCQLYSYLFRNIVTKNEVWQYTQFFLVSHGKTRNLKSVIYFMIVLATSIGSKLEQYSTLTHIYNPTSSCLDQITPDLFSWVILVFFVASQFNILQPKPFDHKFHHRCPIKITYFTIHPFQFSYPISFDN